MPLGLFCFKAAGLRSTEARQLIYSQPGRKLAQGVRIPGQRAGALTLEFLNWCLPPAGWPVM